MNLPKQQNIVLDHRYFNGDFRDYSGNLNHGTPTGCYFQKKPDKHVNFGDDTANKITVTDSSELQLTGGTIICYGDFDSSITSPQRFVAKEDAGGANYQFLAVSSTVLRFDDGTTSSNATLNWDGKKSLAVSFESGSAPKFYLDGAYSDDGASSVTVTADDADLIVGNLYSGTYSSSPLKGVLIYNTALTDEEIAQAHEWIMSTFSPSYPKKNFVYPSQIPQGKDTSYGAQTLADGDMEAVGTAAWTEGNDAVLTKETTDPQEGTQLLRVTYDGTPNPFASEITRTVGKKYRMTGYARGDGTANPRVYNGTGAPTWTGTSSTDWQYFDLVTEAAFTSTILQAETAIAGYCDFDSVRVVEVKETVVVYDMKNVYGSVIDKTGNGNNGTIGSTTSQSSLIGLPALEFHADANGIITLDSNISVDLNGATLMGVFKLNDASVNSCLFGNTTSSISYLDIVAASNIFFLETDTNGDTASGNFTTDTQWHHFAMTGSNKDIKFYLDGVDVTKDGSQSVSDNNLTLSRLGARGSTDPANAKFAEFRVYNHALSQAEIQREYNKYARMPYFLDDLKDANESVANNSGAGNYLENTDWKIDSGTWKITRDENLEVGAKVLECTADGLLYTDSQQAYGTWEFDYFHSDDPSTRRLSFIADDETGGENGYSFTFFSATPTLAIQKFVAGSGTVIMQTAAGYVTEETWYRIRITRRYDGQLSLYIKSLGGGTEFPDWTLVDVSGGSGTNPITDNATTTSMKIVTNFDTGDKIANFKFYNGVLTP